ncbi:Lrp/AsnC family transcriptional regulator [Lacrimispora sp. 210928-DFI.3.58]|uniref:Lrp/AsnC family transcriptional regulator n=1 Tax=Lacrimispora sp. 210928-DFI.3.58 TaxID=2883214 RepID=UPI0015B68B76|nr:Lrp/AsnC family transcriptional regulator [Lacrimispora sp. 210928-DFI.3.58]MCB7319290.1 Lrp/AsnC family transcriptional regulator [Lacrimispora sp. 210928-DFI.3.58]
MDKLDYRILGILKENGRVTASDISKEIHLSVSAVLERIKKMEESGIIKGYTVMVDSKALGNDVTALMEISLEHPRFHDAFTEIIKDHPNIVDCYYLTGDYDFIVKISCASSDDLESIHRTIKSTPGVSATRTHFVLKEIKNIYSAIPEEGKLRI